MVEVQPVLKSNVTYGLTKNYSVIACNFPLTRQVGERHLQFARKQISIQIPLTDFIAAYTLAGEDVDSLNAK